MKYLMPFLMTCLLLVFHGCNKQKETHPWHDPDVDFPTRVDQLVAAMTLEEKVSQMTHEAAPVERLGIPAYNWWNECLHGVARMGKATVFPQAIGLAATFDQDHMHQVASVISDEGRAKYHRFQKQGKRGIYQGLTYWTPNINIFRDPRWGRGMETYGEDPHLTGKMAVAFIKGLQGDDPKYLKAVATSKHYIVHSGPEPDRHSFDAVISERDFRDTYLPHFKMTVEEADVYSVMCAYNRYQGEACCGSHTLMTELLRDELGFDGYVVSDCWAIRDFYTGHFVSDSAADASALAVRSGTDLNCGSTYPALLRAVDKGLITEEEIDVSVKRLMMARMKLGMFDPDEMVPWSDLPYDAVDSEEHRKIALETARKSIVLLKNEGILPLQKGQDKIAVIGPNANDIEVLLANYNGIPVAPVTPLQGIIDKAGDENVVYAMGCEHAENLPSFEAVPASALFTGKDMKQSGLQARYYSNQDFEGEPAHSRIDQQIDFYWWDQAPMPDLDDDDFSIVWEGCLVPPETGRYAFGGEGMNRFRITLNDTLEIRFNGIHHARKTYRFVDLVAGEPCPLRVEFSEFHGDASIQLQWAPPGKDLMREAMEAVDQADKVVMFMGLSPRLEGEEMRVQVKGFAGGDRLDLQLPGVQKDLIRKIYQTGKPVILVLLNGSALAINWEQEHLPAIVEAWYGGQAAGTAIADVLFGEYNPAGRLPVTFYRSVNDLPPFEDYDMAGRTYRYFEKDPLYAFGFGLSYASFTYSEPVLDKNTIARGESATLTAGVTNTSKTGGEEVVQLYIRDDRSGRVRPLKELKGFQRVYVGPGETKTLSFEISPSLLAFYHTEEGDYLVEPGTFTLFTGGSSMMKDLKQVKLTVTE